MENNEKQTNNKETKENLKYQFIDNMADNILNFLLFIIILLIDVYLDIHKLMKSNLSYILNSFLTLKLVSSSLFKRFNDGDKK